MSSLAVSIPDGWTWKTVGEFTTEHKQGYYTKESYVSNGIFLIRITDLGNPKIEYSNMPKLEIDDKEFNQFKVSIGDFLFARSGAIGRYGIVTSDLAAVFASYLIRFRFNDQLVITRYFGYLYESDLCQKQLASITQGSSNININAENIKSLLVPFAPLPEQQKIAAILTSVDEVIESTQAQINKLKDLKTGMMQELLTKGIGHSEFKDSPVGRIPKAWDCVLLDKVARRGSGHTPDKQTKEYWNGGIKWVSLADSSKLDKLHISETENEISSDGIKNSSAVLHPKGTVVLSRDAGIGKSAVTTDAMAVSQHFMAWICGEKLNNYFLYYLLQMWKPRFENIAMGSTIKTIGLQYFKTLEIPLPEISEQIKIAESFLSLDDSIFKAERKRNHLTNIKKALMQDLLTGKVRVKVS